MKLYKSVCHINTNQNKMQFKYVMVYLDEHQMKHLIIMDVQLTLDITTWRMNSFTFLVETASDKKN